MLERRKGATPMPGYRRRALETEKEEGRRQETFQHRPGRKGRNHQSRCGAGQGPGAHSPAEGPTSFYLSLGPGTRDSEKPPSVIPFPPIEPPEPTMTGATMSADNRNAQHHRAHRTRNTRDATARPPNPDRRRFLGISHNVSGCRTRRAGAAFAAPGKRRDRPRVGRKERSDWSRQPGVMRSVAQPASTTGNSFSVSMIATVA
jgi:hypothetical protein